MVYSWRILQGDYSPPRKIPACCTLETKKILMIPRPIESCYWVVPGQLLAGEYPRDVDDEAPRAKLTRLAAAKVAAFIDLTEEGEWLPYSQWLTTETHQRFPVVDSSVPKSPELTTAVLDAIDEHIAQGRVVYVHCRWGVGRTGTIIGCWLARHGNYGAAALARLDELWQHCPESRNWDCPETWEQERYILSWEERS